MEQVDRREALEELEVGVLAHLGLVGASDASEQARERVDGDGPARRRLILDPGAGTGGTTVSQDVALASGEAGVVSANLPIPGVRPWSPADPRLYQLTARLQADGTVAAGADENGRAADDLAVRYGMRAVEVAGARLCLNGEPVFLKGLNWHEETAERGRSMRREHPAGLQELPGGRWRARSCPSRAGCP